MCVHVVLTSDLMLPDMWRKFILNNLTFQTRTVFNLHGIIRRQPCCQQRSWLCLTEALETSGWSFFFLREIWIKYIFPSQSNSIVLVWKDWSKPGANEWMNESRSWIWRWFKMISVWWCQLCHHWGWLGDPLDPTVQRDQLQHKREAVLTVTLLQPFLEVHTLPFQLYLALMSSTQHWFFFFFSFFEARHYETFMPFCHARARSASSARTATSMEPFRQGVKHLRKCCLRVTVGIRRASPRDWRHRCRRCADLPAES